MLQSSVGSQHRVVGFNNGIGQSRSRINAELQLRLLAVVGGKALENESTKTGTSSTTKRVEDKEALQARTVVRETTDLIHNEVNLLLSNGVVSASICQAHQGEPI